MTPLPACLITLALTLLAFFVTRDLLAKRSRVARIAWFVCLSFACAPGLWFVCYYGHFLPESENLYTLRSMRFSESFLVLLGGGAGALAAMSNRISGLFLAALAAIAVAVPFVKPLLFPLHDSAFHETWIGNTCAQSTQATCGPASAATILRHLGDTRAGELSLAREAWTSASGTEAWHLARALRKRGYVAEFRFHDSLPDARDLPGIAGAQLGAVGHFIAILSREGDNWTIADSLSGETIVDSAALRDRYHIQRFFLAIRRR